MSNGRSGRSAGPAPTLTPQRVGTGPRQLTEVELALTGEPPSARTTASAAPAPVGSASAGPSLEPPGVAGPVPAAAATAGAFRALRILALFSGSTPDGGWVYLDGIGWRRIAATNHSAHNTLGLLAAAARVQGTEASVREESDNQIHEMYVW